MSSEYTETLNEIESKREAISDQKENAQINRVRQEITYMKIEEENAFTQEIQDNIVEYVFTYKCLRTPYQF